MLLGRSLAPLNHKKIRWDKAARHQGYIICHSNTHLAALPSDLSSVVVMPSNEQLLLKTCEVQHSASIFLAFLSLVSAFGTAQIQHRRLSLLTSNKAAFLSNVSMLGPWTGQSDRQGVACPWFSLRSLIDPTSLMSSWILTSLVFNGQLKVSI